MSVGALESSEIGQQGSKEEDDPKFGLSGTSDVELEGNEISFDEFMKNSRKNPDKGQDYFKLEGNEMSFDDFFNSQKNPPTDNGRIGGREPVVGGRRPRTARELLD